MNTYYLASPGFNEKQLNRIKEIENNFINKSIKFYSPFTHGGTLSLGEDTELNKHTVKLFFDENIDQIDNCSNLVALVADDDKGTNFEIGYKLGKCDLNPFYINKFVTLIDDKDGRMSLNISIAIDKALSIIDRQYRVFVMDITKKSSIDYVLFGILYAYEIEVVTWSDTILDSNLMTACSTSVHYQEGVDGNLRIDELQHMAIHDPDSFRNLFESKRFNLSNMKFKSKIE